MKPWRLLFVLALIIGLASPSWAVVVTNSQGSAGAPVSVGTTPVKVLAANPNRLNWLIEPETVNVRCTFGSYSQASGAFTAPSAPSATVGFLITSGYFPYGLMGFGNNVYTNGSNAFARDLTKVEVDCVLATGTTATLVDTLEQDSK